MSGDSAAVESLSSEQSIRLLALDRAITAKSGGAEPSHRNTLELADSFASFITDGNT